MIGDGGFVFSLEKRGYVKAGPWTPEAAIEHPDAGKLIQDSFWKILPLILKKCNICLSYDFLFL